jgi:glycine cleavage system H protein
MSNYPTDRRYDSDGAWVQVEGKIATIGVNQWALDQLENVSIIHFVVSIGHVVSSGRAVATVESVKVLTDLFAPVSGKIIAINSVIRDQPDLVNDDPYGAGWFCKIEMSNPDEYQTLNIQPG